MAVCGIERSDYVFGKYEVLSLLIAVLVFEVSFISVNCVLTIYMLRKTELSHSSYPPYMCTLLHSVTRSVIIKANSSFLSVKCVSLHFYANDIFRSMVIFSHSIYARLLMSSRPLLFICKILTLTPGQIRLYLYSLR